MTTPPPPMPPPGPDDDRDPQVAAWLTVEPLDAPTRSRLVAAALAGADADPSDESGKSDGSDASAGSVTPLPSTTRRRAPYRTLVSVAAAVLAVLVVAGALLLPGDDDPTPTAKGAPASTPAPEASREAGDATALAPESQADAAGAAAETPLALPSIGDLGDVSTEAKLTRAARAAGEVPAGSPTVTVGGCALSAARAFGTPVAAGTGRIDGRPATVVVARPPSGGIAIVAVRGPTCAQAVSVVVP